MSISPLSRRRLMSLCAIAALAASACGGNADDNYQSTDLYAAYDALTFGMNAALVESIIGTAPVSKTPANDGVTLYRWETDRGTRLYTALLLQFEEGFGLIGKTITGPEGSKSAPPWTP
jgi:hypothetical protein